MATDVFAAEVGSLSSKLLGGPISADAVTQDEQVVVEGYREALR